MLDSKFVMHMGDGQPRPPKGVPLIRSSLGPPADAPGYMMPLWDDDDLLSLVLKEMCEGALYDFAAFGIPGPHMAKAKNDNWLKVYAWLCVTSKRISRLVRLDAVWSLATQNRWRLHLKEKEWLDAASQRLTRRREQVVHHGDALQATEAMETLQGELNGLINTPPLELRRDARAP